MAEYYSNYVASKFNAAFCTLKYSISYIVGTHHNTMTAFYKGTALIIPVLVTLLQLKNQLGTTDGRNNSPFATHQRTMLVAVSGSVAFYLSYVALLRSTTRSLAAAAHGCLACSGYASVASLTSLLFPDPVTPYVYSMFLLISAAEMVYYYRRRMHGDGGVGFEAYRRSINRFVNDMCRIAANSFGQQPHVLPV